MKYILYKDEKSLEGFEEGYVIARDGIYLKTKTNWFEALKKVDTIPELKELKENTYLTLKMKPIPFGLLINAWKFFRKVYEKYESEAMAYICYEDSVGYWLSVPEQEVSMATLNYNSDGTTSIVGTIHSHANMSAFHSSGDDHDEENFDGIHITLGNVDESFPSMSISAMYGGERYMYTLYEVFDMGDMSETLDIDKAFKEKVKESLSVTKFSGNNDYLYGYDKYYRKNFGRNKRQKTWYEGDDTQSRLDYCNWEESLNY